MRSIAHSHQDRADLKPACLHLENVPNGGRSIKIRENEHVCRSVESRMRHDSFADRHVESRVRMHLALVVKVTRFGIKDSHCFAHPLAGVAVKVPELAVAAERDLRLVTEPAHVPCCAQDDVGDLLGRGFGMNMRVGHEQKDRLRESRG